MKSNYIRNENDDKLKDHDKSCCKHMNHIIEEKSQMAGPTILMVDELLPWTGSATKTSGGKNIYDWSSLQLSPKVDVLMAVAPAPSWVSSKEQFQLRAPSHPTIYTQQLLQQHRNFAQLARLLSCIKCHLDVLSGKIMSFAVKIG